MNLKAHLEKIMENCVGGSRFRSGRLMCHSKELDELKLISGPHIQFFQNSALLTKIDGYTDS